MVTMKSRKQNLPRTHVSLHYILTWLMYVGGFATDTSLCNVSTVCFLWFMCKQSRVLENYTPMCATNLTQQKTLSVNITHRWKQYTAGQPTEMLFTELRQVKGQPISRGPTKKGCRDLIMSNAWSQMVRHITCVLSVCLKIICIQNPIRAYTWVRR